MDKLLVLPCGAGTERNRDKVRAQTFGDLRNLSYQGSPTLSQSQIFPCPEGNWK